jgi:uracil phosphoribosyltransferase/adenylate kinase/phosphoserine phosphatase
MSTPMTTDQATELVPVAGAPPLASNNSNTDSNIAADEPTIIGIYGLPGSGKTTMLKLLKSALTEDHQAFHFIEGSESIKKALPQGVTLETFKFQTEEVKLSVRTKAINDIVDLCREGGKPAIVTGHFIFWDGEGEVSKPVMNDADKKAFTHILYLDVAPEVIWRRREEDNRTRAAMEVGKLEKWQKEEMSGLQDVCRENEILFATAHDHSEAYGLIRNFTRFNSKDNEEEVAEVLEMSVKAQAFRHKSMGIEEFDGNEAEMIEKVKSLMKSESVSESKMKTMLVIDADKTLAPDDASKLFWEELAKIKPATEDRLKWNFSGPKKYTYTSFRQAGFLYYQVDYTDFKLACSKVVARIKIRPEFKQLLSEIADSESAGVVVATCGIGSIWREVLQRDVPGKDITVIGCNESIGGYVVTPETKANLVTRLRDDHNMYVCAIGDSHVDIEMLTRADMSFVVVGPEEGRSTSVEPELSKAIKENGLRARQILFPPESTPRLTDEELPKAEFDAASFVKKLEDSHGLNFVHATGKPAAQLLATDSRNIDIHGLELHRVHRKIGWYLATHYVSKEVGVDPYSMTSVQGKALEGHKLRDESKTLIVPLMRGGEPMARGVWEAFPDAMFLHAKEPTDVQAMHLDGKWTVILVDAVINSGASIVEFVRHIREKLSRQVRIVVVAGVMQEGAISKIVEEDGKAVVKLGLLKTDLVGMGDVTLVALRTSVNAYSGKGPTDTGHRLFNSTHLD